MGEAIDVAARQGGDPGQMAQEIQQHALRREERPRGTGDFRHGLIGLHARGVGGQNAARHAGVIFVEDRFQKEGAGDDALPPGDDPSGGLEIGLDGQLGGLIAGAQILTNRELNEGVHGRVDRRRSQKRRGRG